MILAFLNLCLSDISQEKFSLQLMKSESIFTHYRRKMQHEMIYEQVISELLILIH